MGWGLREGRNKQGKGPGIGGFRGTFVLLRRPFAGSYELELMRQTIKMHNPQHIILFHHFRRLLEAAAVEGIDVAPLKGAHLLTGVYPDDEDRGVMSDVDFLVRKQDWARTLELMNELGFERRDHFADESHTHEAGFYLQVDDTRKILFEPHRYLFEPDRFTIDHDALWERSFESTFDGTACRRLALEDHFCHIAFHATIHRLMSLERTVRDLDLLLRSIKAGLQHPPLPLAGEGRDGVLKAGLNQLPLPSPQWGGAGGGVNDFPAKIIERAREWKVTRSVWLFFSLISEVRKGVKTHHLSHGDEPNLSVAAVSIAPPRPVRAAIRLAVPDSRGTRLARLHHRIAAAVLWPVLFDNPLLVARFVANHPVTRKIR